MILFLDFDGVMHPNNQPDLLFVWVPRRAMWLDVWPAVDVVISSSWRVHHPQREMVEMLGPVIGSRIVGCTPWVGQEREDNVHPALRTTVLTHERQLQVDAWMASSWEPESAWVALDDMPYLFEVNCARLVVCAGRQGMSRENAALGAVSEAEKANRVQPLEKYLEHSGAWLPGGRFRATVDRDRLLIAWPMARRWSRSRKRSRQAVAMRPTMRCGKRCSGSASYSCFHPAVDVWTPPHES